MRCSAVAVAFCLQTWRRLKFISHTLAGALCACVCVCTAMHAEEPDGVGILKNALVFLFVWFFFKHWCVQVSVYVYGMHACIYIVLWYVEFFFSVEANPYIKILSFLLPPLATNLRSSDSYSLIALGKRKQTDFEPRFPLHWPTSAQQKN